MLLFENKGLIHLTALTVSGVSAKVNENPIGQFGTGIKYAIAIVLRLGGSVTVMRGSKRYDFGVSKEIVRGKPFSVVTMNKRKLGYTTDLGKHWLPWMAYRELWSNTRDEGGTVRRTENGGFYAPRPGHTVFVVNCPELERAHDERHTIILQSEPLVVMPGLEVHAGASRHVYYRGIRAAELPEGKTAQYTYNITTEMTLTEDRTLAYSWHWPTVIARGLVQCTNMAVLHSVIGPDDKGHWEAQLPFDAVKDQKPSPQFMEVAEQLKEAKRLSSAASGVFNHYKDTLPGHQSPYLVTLTGAEEQVVQSALQLLHSRTPLRLERGALSFKTRLQLGQVQVATNAGLVLDHRLILQGPEALALALVEGSAALAGDSVTANLCRLVLGMAMERKQPAETADYGL